MDMVGHDNVGENTKIVRTTGLLDNLFEDILQDRVFEVWAAAVTTEGDE
jgi:hypothetical protein